MKKTLLYLTACSMVLLLLFVVIAKNTSASNEEADIKKLADEKYQYYLERFDLAGKIYSSNDLLDREEFQNLVKLGPPAIPHFVELIDKEAREYKALVTAINAIIGNKRLLRKRLNKNYATEFMDWLKNERYKTEFEEYYSAWKTKKAEAKKDGSEIVILEIAETIFDDAEKTVSIRRRFTEAGEAYNELKSFGIEILPIIIDKIENEKDYDLLKIFGDLTNGLDSYFGYESGSPPRMNLDKRVEYVLNWWGKEKNKWAIGLPKDKKQEYEKNE